MRCLESRHLKPSTEQSYRIHLNSFFRAMGHPLNLPKLRVKARLPVQPSDLVTPDEVKRLIAAADHPRDKALIAVTYETAARAREILGIRRKDLTFEPTHGRVRVTGKTGERIIPILESVPYLLTWLNNVGPLQPEECIWQGRRGPLKYSRFLQIVRRLSQAALGRAIHPHLLRHSRATYLVKHPKMSTAVICQLAGWVQGTAMLKRYIHLAGADVDQAFLAMHGKTPVTEPVASPLEPITCPRCHYANPADARFCAQCSLALDMQEAIAALEDDRLLERVLQEPSVQAVMRRTLRKLLPHKQP